MNNQDQPLQIEGSVDQMSAASDSNTHQVNGKLAKGKKTEAGKAASAKNAVKHGLSANSFVLLPTEDVALYNQTVQEFQAALRPRDAVEHHLVSEMVEAIWLIKRSKEIERVALFREMYRQRQDAAERGEKCDEAVINWLATDHLMVNNSTYASMARYRAQFERTYHRCQKALESHRKTKPFTPDAPLEPSSVSSASLFVASHYETKPSEPSKQLDQIQVGNCPRTTAPPQTTINIGDHPQASDPPRSSLDLS